MKTIVIYYTLEGNSGFAARTAAELTGAALEELKVEKEPPRGGFKKFLVGGGSALFKADPGLRPIRADLEEYENVVLAFPIWAGNYPPAIGAFLKRYSIRDKDVYVIASSASGNAGKSAANVDDRTGGRVRGVLSLLNPLKDQGAARDQIKSFVEEYGLTE